ncbi:hypothetical protein D3C77_772280 [compost metagenome]
MPVLPNADAELGRAPLPNTLLRPKRRSEPSLEPRSPIWLKPTSATRFRRSAASTWSKVCTAVTWAWLKGMRL